MLTTPRTAHDNSASAALGWTLPAILDDVCAHRPSPRALNQRSGDGWHPISSAEFQTAADEIAAGLASLGFERGDRVALLMRSEAMFVVTDMGCLVAGLIDVPIYPSSDPEACAFILRETEAGVLFVSDAAMLERVAENIVHMVLARLPDTPEGTRGISLFLVPKFLPDESGGIGELNAVSCGSIEKKMGLHGSPTCVMNFDGALGHLVGPPHAGMRLMFEMMNRERLATGMMGVGLGEIAYQNAVAGGQGASRAPQPDGIPGRNVVRNPVRTP